MNAFSRSVLQWYSEFGRDLPWRRTRDPYAVWLSEIILQHIIKKTKCPSVKKQNA